jgi:hypothetical protein
MKLPPRVQFATLMLIVFLGSASAQVKDAVAARTFKSDAIGLSYTIPDGFVSAPGKDLPQDPNGREHVLLALWEGSHRTPVPRVVFLYDSLARSSNLSPQTIAEDFLKSLQAGPGFKMGTPHKSEVAGVPMWRMDYWHPDDSGQSYNSAIAVPLADRTVLLIQLNAASDTGLNALFNSLQSLRLDSPRFQAK